MLRTSLSSEEFDAEGLPNNLWIDMVKFGSGCRNNCISCGAFDGFSTADRKVKAIGLEDLEGNLTQEIVNPRDGTKFKVADLLARYITTGVDMEPLGPGIFPEGAELIYNLTSGRTKMVAVSHGLASIERIIDGQQKFLIPGAQKERLAKINDLMVRDIVPIFILSMDTARAEGLPGETARKLHREICGMEDSSSAFMGIVESEVSEALLREPAWKSSYDEGLLMEAKAKVKKALVDSVKFKMVSGAELTEGEEIIAEYIRLKRARKDAVVEVNARGYAETLFMLKGAVEAGKKVTISLQGDSKPDSLAHNSMAESVLKRTAALLREEYGFPNGKLNDFLARINLNAPRAYVAAGRAKSVLGVSGGTCEVIPDMQFVTDFIYEEDYRPLRGKLEGNGTLEVQFARPSRRYNDTVSPGPDNPWKVVSLTSGDVRKSVGKKVGENYEPDEEL